MDAGVILFAAAIALGAFLLFLVEPLSAKALLPLFGGTSAVWLTCLLFFQLALLCGYLFADLVVRKLRPRAQAAAHLALLALGLACLPLSTSPELPPWLLRAPPIVQLLLLLTRSVGLPFIALSATGPIVQALAARRLAASTYRLYALSNLASLLGLVSYPFLVEPRLPLHAQGTLFSIAYLLFAICAAIVSLRSARDRTGSGLPGDDLHSNDLGPMRESSRDRTLWLLLPACSSALLIAVTGHLTRNVAPIPLLWMLPLAAYLISFIVCFDSPRWVQRAWSVPGAIGAIALLAFADGWTPPDHHLAWSIAALTAAFLLIACALHAELARLRPAATGLTRFYFSLSLGSALGSIAAAVLVPLVSRGLPELALALVASSLALIAVWWPELKQAQRFSLSGRAASLIGLAVMMLSLALRAHTRTIGSIFLARNFYGSLRVQELSGERGRLRVLFNGTTIHGLQLFAPDASLKPLSYYSATSGVGRALEALRTEGKPLHVGTIGLGAGILAGACRAQDRFDFYEVNPLVEQVAREQFTFLKSCAGARVSLGDARLVLEAQPSQQFDLLVLDAFSSDSIPVHLLTAEAFAIYLRHLAPAGLIAVHVSNRYLDLEPAIAAHARKLGLHGLAVTDDTSNEQVYPSDWILLGREAALLEGPLYTGATLTALDQIRALPEWTDDESNIAAVFR
jgi:hypothetical protein